MEFQTSLTGSGVLDGGTLFGSQFGGEFGEEGGEELEDLLLAFLVDFGGLEEGVGSGSGDVVVLHARLDGYGLISGLGYIGNS